MWRRRPPNVDDLRIQPLQEQVARLERTLNTLIAWLYLQPLRADEIAILRKMLEEGSGV
jgi:hypothetical protein